MNQEVQTTHIGINQRIREQDCVPGPGGLIGLVLGDGFGAVKVVFLGYDGWGGCHCLSKTIKFLRAYMCGEMRLGREDRREDGRRGKRQGRGEDRRKRRTGELILYEKE